MRINDKPIEDYELAYQYLQAFYADFHFNENQPIEKAKAIALIYQVSKKLYEEKCKSILDENGVGDKELSKYHEELSNKNLMNS